jgi:transposase-like protein
MGIIDDVIKHYISELSKEEKAELLAALVAAIDRELVESLLEESVFKERCPRCGCAHTVGKGKPGGHPRRLCRGCKKTYGTSTDRVLAMSKLPREVWVGYARCMMDSLSLRECATRCNVSLKTSFFMRHRITECMEGCLGPFAVGEACSAEIDEVYLRESFKGNHSQKERFTMPRKPKRRKGDGVRSGTSKDQICVMTGISDRGDIFLEVAAMGRLTRETAERVLQEKVFKGAIISTDDHHAYRGVLREIGVAAHWRYKASDRSYGVINAVNALHSRLKDFLKRFKGVSSRWVESYLIWLRWTESLRIRNNRERAERAVAHAVSGYYQTKIRDCWEKPYLFQRFAPDAYEAVTD